MILKIIGIILLTILAVLILLLVLILLVPVRYRITGGRKSQMTAPIEIKIKITWLLHLVRILFSWPDSAYIQVKFLFFTVYKVGADKLSPRQAGQPKAENRSDAEKDHDQANELAANESAAKDSVANDLTVKESAAKDSVANSFAAKEAAAKDAPSKSPPDHAAATDQSQAETIHKNKYFESLEPAAADLAEPLMPEEDASPLTDDVSAPPQRQGPLKKVLSAVKKPFDKIKKVFDKIRYTLRGIYAKIKDVAVNIRYYTEIIKSDEFRKAFSLCASQLGKIFRHIRPRTVKADLTVGGGDPASTGQILEIYSILYPFIGNNIFITPDFEEKRLEGDFLIKGRITVNVLLRAAWKIYRDKNIRKLLKLLKREVGNGR